MLFVLDIKDSPGVLCNMEYLPETHLKLKKKEHGSDTALLFAKFQDDLII